MKKNKKLQSNNARNARSNMNVNQRGNTNNTSNTRTKSTNQNSTQYRDVGFEPSADGAFELDEDSEHSFELRDCKSAQSKKE